MLGAVGASCHGDPDGVPQRGGGGFGRVLRPLAQQPDAGALPQLYAATDPGARGGELIGPDGRGELRGGPARVPLAAAATDAGTGQRLWEVSERLTDVRFPFPGSA